MEPFATKRCVELSNASLDCNFTTLSQPYSLRCWQDVEFLPPYLRILPMLDPVIREVQAGTSYAPTPNPRTTSDLTVDQTANNPCWRGSCSGQDFDQPQRPNWTQLHTDRFSSER
jgi:hypothetical protein